MPELSSLYHTCTHIVVPLSSVVRYSIVDSHTAALRHSRETPLAGRPQGGGGVLSQLATC